MHYECRVPIIIFVGTIMPTTADGQHFENNFFGFLRPRHMNMSQNIFEVTKLTLHFVYWLNKINLYPKTMLKLKVKLVT